MNHSCISCRIITIIPGLCPCRNKRIYLWGTILHQFKRADCRMGWSQWETGQKAGSREAERLRISFESAREAGFRKYIMFLHYPPTNIVEEESSSRGWPKSTEWSMLYIPTATESPVTATVSTEFTMGSGITWFLETTSILSLKRSWIRSSTGTVE